MQRFLDNLDRMQGTSPPVDTYLSCDECRKDDIVIPVLGPTGSGKSTFISNLIEEGQIKPKVDDGLDSCTKQLQHYFIDPPQSVVKSLNSRRIVLVDTPGFDDTEISDFEILRRVAVWLSVSYKRQMKVGALVYIYPLSSSRYTHKDHTNLRIFKKMCGNDARPRVIMVASKRDLYTKKETREKREVQLRSHWKTMLDGGSKMEYVENSHESASKLLKAVIDTIIELDRKAEFKGVILALQEQIVDRRRELPKTAAARELKKKLDELMKEYKSMGDDDTVRANARELAAQLSKLKLSLIDRLNLFLRG